jgi:hypothetical protein
MYTLTAESNTDTIILKIDSPSDEQAVMEAINIIMDNAYDDKAGAWAIGAITLTDEHGYILQSMESKEGE